MQVPPKKEVQRTGLYPPSYVGGPGFDIFTDTGYRLVLFNVSSVR
jgi:hypothetical protein